MLNSAGARRFLVFSSTRVFEMMSFGTCDRNGVIVKPRTGAEQPDQMPRPRKYRLHIRNQVPAFQSETEKRSSLSSAQA